MDQSAWPAYLTGPFSLGPRIFSRQCFASISVRREEVQKEMAKDLCMNKNKTTRPASDPIRVTAAVIPPSFSYSRDLGNHEYFLEVFVI
jgi:hypothetical protein